MEKEPYTDVSPPRFSMPSGRPSHLFAKSRPELPIRVFSGEYRLLSSCALKVLPPKHLGDPPPSLCLGINPRFSALICWRKNTVSERIDGRSSQGPLLAGCTIRVPGKMEKTSRFLFWVRRGLDYPQTQRR